MSAPARPPRLPRLARAGVVLLLASLPPVLAGCSNSEPTVASAVVHAGLLGGLGEQLKREDDETEARELRERAPQTAEERREGREAAESEAIAAEPAGAEQPEEGG